jgi:hypothetical protein
MAYCHQWYSIDRYNYEEVVNRMWHDIAHTD